MISNQNPIPLTREAHTKSPKTRASHLNGFTLIVTVSMLVLLTLVAVGLMSLCTLSIKSTGINAAQERARANARLALTMAIDELQISLGPDQRISANAAILNHVVGTSGISHPHWVGVWDSWRAGEFDPSETRIDPASDHQTIPGVTGAGMHPTYEAKRADHFRKWMVSLRPEEAQSISSPLDLTLVGGTHPSGVDDAVCLVGEGTLGADRESDKVTVRLIDVQDDPDAPGRQGRYGWWIGDESQKARVMGDPYPANPAALTIGDSLFRQQSAGTTGTSVVRGLENIPDDRKLTGLQSLQTINLVNGVNGKPSENFHHITSESFGVLADVREGGLKRDLSTLLERAINISDSGDEFMLYRFDTNGQKRVPIQDLAAYYQLYKNDSNWDNGGRGGVIHSAGSIRVEAPDFGGPADINRDRYLRQYSSIYRNPVPIKSEFILAYGAEPISQELRDWVNARATDPDHPQYDGTHQPLRDSDTHRLRLGILPVVTLWNPNNVPLVMNHTQRFMFNTPPFGFSIRKYVSGEGSDYNNGIFDNGYINLNYAQGESTRDGRATRTSPWVTKFLFAATRPVVFEPGEVKVFSLPSDAASSLFEDYDQARNSNTLLEPINEWDPYGFFKLHNSAKETNGYPVLHVLEYSRRMPESVSPFGRTVVFGINDKISVQIVPEGERTIDDQVEIGANVSPHNEVHGGAFNISMIDEDFFPIEAKRTHFRHYMLMSRFGGRTNYLEDLNSGFNRSLMTWGFPGQEPRIPYDTEANSISGSQLIAAQQAGEVRAFMQFSMTAGCETNSLSLGGYGGGRRVTTRPFLHGATLTAPFIDQSDGNHLYNVGWQWQVDRINNIEDSTIQGIPGSGNGFYGGGYSIEAGATHVIQRDIPVAPPISIAALGHSILGGHSLADAPVAFGKDDLIDWAGVRGNRPWREGPPDAFQQVTATGQLGRLGPHTLQAIGNSYAHPLLASNQAYMTWNRYFDADQGDPANGVVAASEHTFVDHSYLANKALWDEYFFSSITPQPSDNPIFDGEPRTAEEVAWDFFFNDVALPNSRMHAVTTSINEGGLQSLFGEKEDYTDGLADKIAAHLMVKGAFNINSTSVEAWKIFLSSLRDKSVASIDNAGLVRNGSIEGVPVGPGTLPGGAPVLSTEIEYPNQPTDQWLGWRVLSDQEIDELAVAIVKQVKRRGPFLSLSEFVNRRLDRTNRELSVKGALQAALDDPNVSINAAFRNPTRQMSGAEIANMDPAFPEALEGPIAYGSAAYVDQADILRHFGSQLTPRGDTFVIRTYGDALDATGQVTARAWCEAVVQRMPEYVDENDDPHLSYEDLPYQSVASRRFGRKLQVVSFRWLHAEEL